MKYSERSHHGGIVGPCEEGDDGSHHHAHHHAHQRVVQVAQPVKEECAGPVTLMHY